MKRASERQEERQDEAGGPHPRLVEQRLGHFRPQPVAPLGQPSLEHC